MKSMEKKKKKKKKKKNKRRENNGDEGVYTESDSMDSEVNEDLDEEKVPNQSPDMKKAIGWYDPEAPPRFPFPITSGRQCANYFSLHYFWQETEREKEEGSRYLPFASRSTKFILYTLEG